MYVSSYLKQVALFERRNTLLLVMAIPVDRSTVRIAVNSTSTVHELLIHVYVTDALRSNAVVNTHPIRFVVSTRSVISTTTVVRCCL
jgi:hypothetical protein